MTETGLFHVFQEINIVDPNWREAAHDYASKFTYYMLETEGIFRNKTGMWILEYSKMIESNYRGFLTDVDFWLFCRRVSWGW